MASPVGRVYATALALLLFFLTWAVVAAQPWASASSARDPRLQALAVREARLRHEAKLVQAIVARRFAAYRVALAARRRATAQAQALAAAQAAPAPSVRVVNLPPITITRTS